MIYRPSGAGQMNAVWHDMIPCYAYDLLLHVTGQLQKPHGKTTIARHTGT